MPGDVIEFGIVRKRFKEYRPTGLLDFNRVTLKRLRDLPRKHRGTAHSHWPAQAVAIPSIFQRTYGVKSQWIGISLKKHKSLNGFTKCNVIQRQRICLAKEENKCGKDSAGWEWGEGAGPGRDKRITMRKNYIGLNTLWEAKQGKVHTQRFLQIYQGKRENKCKILE